MMGRLFSHRRVVPSETSTAFSPNQTTPKRVSSGERHCRDNGPTVNDGAPRAQMTGMGLLKFTFFPLSGVTDEQAMWRVQKHDDHAAFAELVRRWQEPVRRLCVRMTGDEHRGEDLAQEAFARVFTRRDDFDPARKFSTWLWRIALNLCHDERRRVTRRGELALEDEDQDGPMLRAFEPTPDEHLVAQERAECVRQALLSLPETHRAVLVLREYEGLKLREIAEALDIPEGTVKSRMADALTRLSRRLQPLIRNEFPAPAAQAKPAERKAMS